MSKRYICIGLLALLIAAPLHAEVVGEKITYEHNGEVLEGYLAYDNSIPGKRPGVIVDKENDSSLRC